VRFGVAANLGLALSQDAGANASARLTYLISPFSN
jgi:hypothetical protein